MSSKCIEFLYVIKSIIVNDCFVICVGLSLLSKAVDMTYVFQTYTLLFTMNLQFVLVIYYLTLVRKSLVSVHTFIYLHSNIYFRNFSNFEVSCGSYLYKGTLTFILLPLLNYDLSYEMSSCRSLCHFSTATFSC